MGAGGESSKMVINVRSSVAYVGFCETFHHCLDLMKYHILVRRKQRFSQILTLKNFPYLFAFILVFLATSFLHLFATLTRIGALL